MDISAGSGDPDGDPSLYPGIRHDLFYRYGFMWQNRRYQVIHDHHRPDVVFDRFCAGENHRSYIPDLVRQIRETFPSKPVVVVNTVELMDTAWFTQDTGIDYFLTSHPDQGNNICVGGMPLSDVMSMMQHFGLEPWMRPHFSPKTKFCNYIYSHPGRNNARQAFCEKLMRYKLVDCPGKSLNNTAFPESPEFPTHFTLGKDLMEKKNSTGSGRSCSS